MKIEIDFETERLGEYSDVMYAASITIDGKRYTRIGGTRNVTDGTNIHTNCVYGAVIARDYEDPLNYADADIAAALSLQNIFIAERHRVERELKGTMAAPEPGK